MNSPGYLVETINDAREIIRNSFPIKEYESRDGEKWDKAFIRYNELLKLNESKKGEKNEL